MGITLETPKTGGPPAVKFPTVGNSIVVGIVNVEDYQQHTMSGEPVVWSDGTPKMGKRVTGLVVSADGAQVGGAAGDRAVQVGELVTFYIEKGKHYTWTDAVKAHAKATGDGVEVGDVMLWKFDHTKPAAKAGHHPQKIYTAAIRKPKADDGDLADRCVAAYHEQAARPSVAAAAPAAPMSDDDVADAFGATPEAF